MAVASGSASGSAIASAVPSAATPLVTNSVTQTKLTAIDGVARGLFGWGVNLSSDGSTALVRASGQNSGHGAAYVFTRSGSVWTQQAELIVSGMTGSLAAGDAALSSDGSTALLSDGQSAAYVFTRSGPEWIDTTPTGAVARWPR